MSGLGRQAIETYDLVEAARQTLCYVCAGGNRCDAEFCRHCRAPLALAYQANNNKKKLPQLVAVIGSTGVGKTVYLGMLTDILSRQRGALQILARGAFSVTLQHQAMSALANRRFPPATPCEPEDWNWVHCEVSGISKRRPIELVLPDVSGTAFMGEVEHAPSVSVIRSFLSRCSAAMVLIDTEQLERGQQDPDFLAMKIVTYLLELKANRSGSWSRRPLALIFSKADHSDACFENPAEFARQYTPGLWHLCHERLRRHHFFASTVVGSCARFALHDECVSMPLRIEPRGVVEPFEWLVDQLPGRR